MFQDGAANVPDQGIGARKPSTSFRLWVATMATFTTIGTLSAISQLASTDMHCYSLGVRSNATSIVTNSRFTAESIRSLTDRDRAATCNIICSADGFGRFGDAGPLMPLLASAIITICHAALFLHVAHVQNRVLPLMSQYAKNAKEAYFDEDVFEAAREKTENTSMSNLRYTLFSWFGYHLMLSNYHWSPPDGMKSIGDLRNNIGAGKLKPGNIYTLGHFSQSFTSGSDPEDSFAKKIHVKLSISLIYVCFWLPFFFAVGLVIAWGFELDCDYYCNCKGVSYQCAAYYGKDIGYVVLQGLLAVIGTMAGIWYSREWWRERPAWERYIDFVHDVDVENALRKAKAKSTMINRELKLNQIPWDGKPVTIYPYCRVSRERLKVLATQKGATVTFYFEPGSDDEKEVWTKRGMRNVTCHPMFVGTVDKYHVLTFLDYENLATCMKHGRTEGEYSYGADCSGIECLEESDSPSESSSNSILDIPLDLNLKTCKWMATS